MEETNKTFTGLPENTDAALTYVLGWVSGLVFFLMVKDNKKIRFHALQSMVLFGGIHLVNMVLGMIPIIGWSIIPFLGLATFVLWLVLIVKTYQGGNLELPVVSEFVKKQMK